MTSTPSSKTALIAGATGLVGTRLLERLLEDPRYSHVVCPVRRPTQIRHPKLVEIRVDFDRLTEELEGILADDWFCTLGTTIKKAGSREAFRRVDYDYPMALGSVASNSGAAQMLTVTALGVSAASRIFYSRVKGELERDLARVGLRKLHLFRPSLLLGDRREFRLGERVGAAVMRRLNPLFAGPLRKYRAIHADTVASAMIAAANRSLEPGVYTYESDSIESLAAQFRV